MERILQILGGLFRGGTESMLMNYYRSIDKTQMQFDFVVHTVERGDYEDEVQNLGGKVFRMPRFNLLNLFQYKRAWNVFFKLHPEYKVIHVHHFLVAGIVLPIAKKHGVQIRIVHSHNTKPPIFILKEKVMWLFHRDLMKYSTQKLACSQAAGEYLYGTEPFIVFNNAIETKKYIYDAKASAAIRTEFGCSENDFVVGHIGSFRTRQKNHSFLVDVFAEIVKLRPQSKLLLVGVGELQYEIAHKVETLGLSDKCVFTGVRSDVPVLLSAMDLFLLPSFFEGLSVVSVEVQASGLPCVASTNVTKESKLTDIFLQYGLEHTPKEWAEFALGIKPSMSREAYQEIVAAAGYDVSMNLCKLTELYLHE